MNGNITVKGRVSADSEIRYTPAGLAVCSFTISLFTGKDADGKYYDSWWCKISLFGDEGAAFKKGEIVSVTGWCKPFKFWKDSAGNNRVDLPIYAKEVMREVKNEDDF